MLSGVAMAGCTIAHFHFAFCGSNTCSPTSHLPHAMQFSDVHTALYITLPIL